VSAHARPARPDIATRADLDHLLRDFYVRAFDDPLLRHVFVDVVHMDLEAHLPVLTDFWQKVLFDEGVYNGQVMAVHRRIHRLSPLTGAHFDRWLQLWRGAVDASFSGPVAQAAVGHAERMASVFLRNLTAPPRELPVVSLGDRRTA
jgi:hemoglobin